MSIFIHKIHAKPQSNGLYGMPLTIVSLTMSYPIWEHEFLISASLMALSEKNPNFEYEVEYWKNNKLIILKRGDSSKGTIHLDYAYFNDGVYYYANKFFQDEVNELTQIKRKHKIENILE